MNIYTKEDFIARLLTIRAQGWVLGRRPGNDGSVGNTLEDLLGIQENNLPIPNAAEWELKAQRKNTSSLTTLFHVEPSPRTLRFVPKILLPVYGWKHEKAGIIYPETEKSFRQTISTTRFSDRGFSVMVDKKERKISIRFEIEKVQKNHIQWMENIISNNGKYLEFSPYWGFDDLFHKAGTKLNNCFFVRAESKRENGKEFFLFSDIFMLKKFSLEKFISAIENGDILIDFDARSGHNHGTKFRIRDQSLPNLYESQTAL
jgi:hypothetical protein